MKHYGRYMSGFIFNSSEDNNRLQLTFVELVDSLGLGQAMCAKQGLSLVLATVRVFADVTDTFVLSAPNH